MDILDQGIYDNKGDFASYKSFHTKEELADFVALMHKHNIAIKVKQNRSNLGTVITGSSINPDFWVEIEQGNFPKANTILREEAERNLADSDLEEHYLNELSDTELTELLFKPDEWSAEAILIAERLLKMRGKKVDPKQLENQLEKRNTALRQPQKVSSFWIGLHLLNAALSGFLLFFSGVILILVFVVVAFAMGLYYKNTKTTTLEGDRFFTFDEKTRSAGRWIITVAAASLFLGFLYFYKG